MCPSQPPTMSQDTPGTCQQEQQHVPGNAATALISGNVPEPLGLCWSLLTSALQCSSLWSHCSCEKCWARISHIQVLPMGCAYRIEFLANSWLCGDPSRTNKPAGLAIMILLTHVVDGLVGVLWERHPTWDAPLHPEAELDQPSSRSTVPPQPVPKASCCCLQPWEINSCRKLQPQKSAFIPPWNPAPCPLLAVSREQAAPCNKVGGVRQRFSP